MPYGNLFSPLCSFLSSSYSMNRVEDIGGVIPIAARITDPNGDILQDYKPLLRKDCQVLHCVLHIVKLLVMKLDNFRNIAHACGYSIVLEEGSERIPV
jgi:hypothetical protein